MYGRRRSPQTQTRSCCTSPKRPWPRKDVLTRTQTERSSDDPEAHNMNPAHQLCAPATVDSLKVEARQERTSRMTARMTILVSLLRDLYRPCTVGRILADAAAMLAEKDSRRPHTLSIGMSWVISFAGGSITRPAGRHPDYHVHERLAAVKRGLHTTMRNAAFDTNNLHGPWDTDRYRRRKRNALLAEPEQSRGNGGKAAVRRVFTARHQAKSRRALSGGLLRLLRELT